MPVRRELLGFALFVVMLFVAIASASPIESEEDILPFAPNPEPDSGAPLSPENSYSDSLLSPESESPSPGSPDTEPESLYPPITPSPTPATETGSPPEPNSENASPEFSPDLSPVPETEPSDSDSDSSGRPLLPLPSMAPITGDDNDGEPTYGPTPSSMPLELDQSDGNGDEEAAENYGGRDGSEEEDHQSKGGSGIVFGVVAGVCLVGLGGFVYLKRRDRNGVRGSTKYNQYLELGRRDSV